METTWEAALKQDTAFWLVWETTYLLYPKTTDIYCLLQSTTTVPIIISHENELPNVNVGIEFAAKISWKPMKRCGRGIVLKQSNSLEILVYAYPTLNLWRTKALSGPDKEGKNDLPLFLEFRMCF